MLTKPLNDTHCLTLIIEEARKRMKDPEIKAIAEKYDSLDAYIRNLRSKPQRDDSPGVLPSAPRIPCWPPQRLRSESDDPNCAERSGDFLPIAELLDPSTLRTLATLRINGKAHTFPVELTREGPVPIILDPYGTSRPENAEESAEADPGAIRNGHTTNLKFATVAQLAGYGPGQPNPALHPIAWAEQLAQREGVTPRNSDDLLALVDRYADLYPGGRQGLASLAQQVAKPIAKVVARTAKEAAKVTAEAASVALEQPEIGQLLRAAIVGHGGPAAVIAIDVIERRLKRRGHSLGSLARSHDADVFAFR